MKTYMDRIKLYLRVEDTVSRQAEVYRMLVKGRGETHEKAYKAGAKLVLDLIRSGKYTLEQLKNIGD